jgi:hypothetical protein
MGRTRSKGGKQPSLLKRLQPPGSKYRNFSLLEEPEAFSLSPSLLAGGGGGGGGGGGAPAPPPPAAAPGASSPFGAALSGFGDLARSLQEVARPPAAAAAAPAGGGAWDFSAFGSEATSALQPAAAAAAPPPPPPPPVFLSQQQRAVADSLHRAHESQASQLAERIRAAELSNKQRSRALRSITVGANYRSRHATKGAKKQAMKKAWK